MQTIILAGSVVGALTTIIVACVKVFKVASKVTKWAETDKKVDDIVTTLEKENEEYAVLETFLTMYDESQG